MALRVDATLRPIHTKCIWCTLTGKSEGWGAQNRTFSIFLRGTSFHHGHMFQTQLVWIILNKVSSAQSCWPTPAWLWPSCFSSLRRRLAHVRELLLQEELLDGDRRHEGEPLDLRQQVRQLVPVRAKLVPRVSLYLRILDRCESMNTFQSSNLPKAF